MINYGLLLWQTVKRFHEHNWGQDDPDRQTEAKVLKLIEEAMEVMKETPWSRSVDKTDIEKIRYEVADVLIVSMGLGTIWFDSFEQMMNYALNKMETNKVRTAEVRARRAANERGV